MMRMWTIRLRSFPMVIAKILTSVAHISKPFTNKPHNTLGIIVTSIGIVVAPVKIG